MMLDFLGCVYSRILKCSSPYVYSSGRGLCVVSGKVAGGAVLVTVSTRPPLLPIANVVAVAS